MNKSLLLLLLLVSLRGFSQGYLHADGKRIVDGAGNNVILRGIGTGNWMIQEGYMMKTADVAGTQHEFRAKLVASIGEAKTDSFYNVWLQNHMTKTDVDSMKAWGFNSIRVALHYVWFTPPIEDEPVAGQITWLNQGFEMVDSLLAWCTANQMYLILDMHGAPGGQGKDANISDYDPSKPSLWDSQANKNKLIVLWKKLAERYATEPWMGGYDLINETNWTFTVSNNQPLWTLFKDITTAIREVDKNHMIILEGNWFANDYTGLPALWDNNLVLSFHKYWTYNTDASIQWMVDLRNQRNVPIWLGESGENSNVWFTSLIALCESKNIGWSWWPVKKAGINNVLQSSVNADYEQLVKNWKGEGPYLSQDAAFAAVLKFADNHKIENCEVKYDVIDALIRQPHDRETKPFKNHVIGNEFFCADYDFGPNNVAYRDNDTANFHINTNQYVAWNKGYAYRNDGVDIEPCTDNVNNGYNVGWAEKGEWMQYTIQNDTEAAYTLYVRSSSGAGGSKIHFELNGEAITPSINLPATNGWTNYVTTQTENIILPKGVCKLRLRVDTDGSNLNYFRFAQGKPVSEIEFMALTAQTQSSGRKVYVTLNKSVTTFDASAAASEFVLKADGRIIPLLSANMANDLTKTIEITASEELRYNQAIELAYIGTSIKNGDQPLGQFLQMTVTNNITKHLEVPGKIEAEDYLVNSGTEKETCTDIGGGTNLSYAGTGDFVEYKVLVGASGNYKVDYRLASQQTNLELVLMTDYSGTMLPIDTIKFEGSGAWQTWKTVSSYVNLNEGIQTLRLYFKKGDINVNWFKFGVLTSAPDSKSDTGFRLYPNPATKHTMLDFNQNPDLKYITVIDLQGKVMESFHTSETAVTLSLESYSKGVYIVWVNQNHQSNVLKLLVN